MIEFPTLFFAGLAGVNQRTVNIMHSKYRDCCTFKFITKGWKSNDFSMLQYNVVLFNCFNDITKNVSF